MLLIFHWFWQFAKVSVQIMMTVFRRGIGISWCCHWVLRSVCGVWLVALAKTKPSELKKNVRRAAKTVSIHAVVMMFCGQCSGMSSYLRTSHARPTLCAFSPEWDGWLPRARSTHRVRYSVFERRITLFGWQESLFFRKRRKIFTK